MKRSILLGLVGVIALGCVVGSSAPSCWHGVACLAATQPIDVVRAATLAAVAGSIIVVLRAAWMTLRLGHALRRLPRGRQGPELEGHGVECITALAPAAFCAGALRPRVYVTDSLVELLDPPELAAVIAHEQAHAHRRDPLRRSLFAAFSDLLLRAPWVLWLRRRYSEHAEISADHAAARLLGPSAVADALTTLAMEGDELSSEAADADQVSTIGLRSIGMSAVATLAVVVMLLCVSQAAVLLSSGRLPHL